MSKGKGQEGMAYGKELCFKGKDCVWTFWIFSGSANTVSLSGILEISPEDHQLSSPHPFSPASFQIFHTPPISQQSFILKGKGWRLTMEVGEVH